MSHKQVHSEKDADKGLVQDLDPAHELPPAEVEAEPPAPQGEELARLRTERDSLHDRWLRAMADFENYRKRMQREVADQRTLAAADVVRAFLPVMDGFERALHHASASSAEDLRRGLELLQRQMSEAGRRLGLEPISTVGERFDPHRHEAVETVASADHPEHTVIEELQRGYKLKDKLIRPAMVKVSNSNS